MCFVYVLCSVCGVLCVCCVWLCNVCVVCVLYCVAGVGNGQGDVLFVMERRGRKEHKGKKEERKGEAQDPEERDRGLDGG